MARAAKPAPEHKLPDELLAAIRALAKQHAREDHARETRQPAQ